MSREIRRTLRLAPRFDEIDMLGVVHNSVYLKWFEQGRLAIMEEIQPLETALEAQVTSPVVLNHCEYKRPVRYRDELVLVTRMRWTGRYTGRIEFLHTLSDARTREVVAEGETAVTLYDWEGKKLIRDIPADIVARIDALARGNGGDG